MTNVKKITWTVSTAAVAGVLGLGAAGIASAQTTPSPSASSTASSSQASGQSSSDGSAASGVQKGGNRKGHGDRGQIASELASKLGIEEAKVSAALDTFRQANTPSGSKDSSSTKTKPDTATQDAALAKSLAATLGVEQTKVATALADIRKDAAQKRASELKSKLDKAVTAGTLTQAEADAVTKAVEKGVIGGR